MHENLIAEARRLDAAWLLCEEVSTQRVLDVAIALADALEAAMKDAEHWRKLARKMHTWIFLHTGDEQKAYDEIGLTDEENAALGYGGQFEIKEDQETSNG